MKNQRLKVTIPPEDRALLRLMAQRADMSEAELIRRMIRRTAGELRITPRPAPATPQAPPAAPSQPGAQTA